VFFVPGTGAFKWVTTEDDVGVHVLTFWVEEVYWGPYHVEHEVIVVVLPNPKVPSQPDADLDGVPDQHDNCPFTPNEDQLDWDGDGMGNACDISKGTAPDPCMVTFCEPPVVPCASSSCDCLSDSQGAAFALEWHTDVDVCGNSCEPDCADPFTMDTDKDTVPDIHDNCVFIPNTHQQDSDGDGMGDACEEETEPTGGGNDCDACAEVEPDTGAEHSACITCSELDSVSGTPSGTASGWWWLLAAVAALAGAVVGFMMWAQRRRQMDA
jgi:hypothetical protein